MATRSAGGLPIKLLVLATPSACVTFSFAHAPAHAPLARAAGPAPRLDAPVARRDASLRPATGPSSPSWRPSRRIPTPPSQSPRTSLSFSKSSAPTRRGAAHVQLTFSVAPPCPRSPLPPAAPPSALAPLAVGRSDRSATCWFPPPPARLHRSPPHLPPRAPRPPSPARPASPRPALLCAPAADFSLSRSRRARPPPQIGLPVGGDKEVIRALVPALPGLKWIHSSFAGVARAPCHPPPALTPSASLPLHSLHTSPSLPPPPCPPLPSPGHRTPSSSPSSSTAPSSSPTPRASSPPPSRNGPSSPCPGARHQ